MVGIVVVSHSNTLVSGIKELVDQMVPEMVKIAYIGGTNDPENPIGTDPMRILEAIGEVNDEDGVLVLMDLGSALLSAETALDFLEQEQRERVRLSSAPLVEGTMSAAIQAFMGSDLPTVAAEAENSLNMKTGQLSGGEKQPPTIEPLTRDGLELSLVIHNPNGLHARPASRLVRCAGSFSAKITIEKDGKRVDAKSINQVMTLGIRKGDRMSLRFEGEDADAAFKAVEALHADHFGEEETDSTPPDTASPPPESTQDGILTGISAAKGYAIGPVLRFEPTIPEVENKTISDTKAEISKLRSALNTAVTTCKSLQINVKTSVGDQQAEIFEFHRLLLEDQETVDTAIASITEENRCAASAWKSATDAVANHYESLTDDYLRARAADVYDIQQTVLRELLEGATPTLEIIEPVILVAQDLSPSEVANLPLDRILGLCLAAGGGTSHAAIIAASRGIPAVVGINGIVTSVENGQLIVLDGERGRIFTAPDSSTVEKFTAAQAQWQVTQNLQKRLSREPALTTDGVRIHIAANIAGPMDVPQALENGAEGVGLFRTEFLFLDRADEPGEDEQYEIYRAVAREMKGRQVIIRTLDIGGDKPVAYLSSDMEANPFLGLRGVRFALANREMFLRQLRAILRTGIEYEIKVMFPMIGSAQDFKEAVRALDEAKGQLRDKRIEYKENLPVGVMIEVPSAVVMADQLAAMADFFSIGTNDLAQYVMAADRGNPKVAALPDPFHPAVLRMIKQTVDAARKKRIPVGMCGAFAGLPEAAGLLIGLGLEELSMNAPMIPAQKVAIRKLSTKSTMELAAKALTLTSSEEVKELVSVEN